MIARTQPQPATPPGSGNAGGEYERLARLRLQLYVGGLAVTFALYMMAHASIRIPVFWIFALATLAALAIDLVRLSSAFPTRFLKWAAIAAMTASALAPLALDAARRDLSFPATVAREPVWSQILVAIFAARVLMEENALRLSMCLRDPLGFHGGARLQSTPAAVAAAVALSLGFYCLLPYATGSFSDPAIQIVAAAVAGATVLHALLIFLFFTAMAHIADAAALVWRQSRAIEQMRSASVRHAAASRSADKSMLETLSLDFPSTMAAEGGALLLAILTGNGETAAPSDDNDFRLSAALAFRSASRRFVRRLVSVLPMIGFLGTIIGLSTTLTHLPSAIGADGGGGSDLSGALAGLSLKFQTTLLGLLGSMICGFCLDLIERREAELDAQMRLIVDAANGTAAISPRRSPKDEPKLLKCE